MAAFSVWASEPCGAEGVVLGVGGTEALLLGLAAQLPSQECAEGGLLEVTGGMSFVPFFLEFIEH